MSEPNLITQALKAECIFQPAAKEESKRTGSTRAGSDTSLLVLEMEGGGQRAKECGGI